MHPPWECKALLILFLSALERPADVVQLLTTMRAEPDLAWGEVGQKIIVCPYLMLKVAVFSVFEQLMH